MDAVSDRELLRRSAGGEGTSAGDGADLAFAELVSRYWPLVHSLALSWTTRADIAEDLAQETFCRAYAHLEDIENPEAFRSWLWGITRNVCYDWLRKSARHPAPLDSSAEGMAGSDDPPRDAAQAECRHRVRLAVDELPEKYRIAVYLRHLEELTYKEIAQMLGMSVSGVSSRLAEAYEMLRVKLRPLL